MQLLPETSNVGFFGAVPNIVRQKHTKSREELHWQTQARFIVVCLVSRLRTVACKLAEGYMDVQSSHSSGFVAKSKVYGPMVLAR